MIVAKIFGGLGNQMFQYAFSKSLAIQNKTDLYLDLSWYSINKSSTQRKFQLDIFTVNFRHLSQCKITCANETIIAEIVAA